MPTIEITTAQQVAIQYDLASARERVMAWFIDMVIVYGTVLLLITVLLPNLDWEQDSWVVYLLLLPIILFYPLVTEVLLHGQTIGKRAMQLKVMRLDGEPPTITDYIIRWLFRIIDIGLSLGSLAVMLISSTEKAQRLGGIVSHTVVIKLRPTFPVALHDILNLREADDYEPTYPQVQQFTDEEMMVIKHALDRIQQYRNGAHLLALDKAARLVAHRIGVKPKEPTAEAFLRTALRDYVILTR